MPWQVLVVEDDADTREFFAASVRQHPQLALAAAVDTVAAALAWMDRSRSLDVLLTDLGLPDGSGLQLIRHAAVVHPACESLVISMFGDEENVLASIEAGALGYIHKDSPPEDIAATILEMKQGGSPISPMVARRVLGKYRASQAAPVARPPAPAAVAVPGQKELLSVREREVLELIARGFSYAEIARLRQISVHTVQTHIKNLYGKLAVHSRTEAVFEATRMGLLPRL